MTRDIRDSLREMTTDRDRLRVALEESLKLQSHYAELLNMHDGGERRRFASVEEYLQRLVEIGTLS